MKLELITTIEIDMEREKERIKPLSSEISNAILKCLEFFETCRFQEAIEAYNKIPYCKDRECYGQEYMPEWFVECLQGFNVHGVKSCNYTIKRITN